MGKDSVCVKGTSHTGGAGGSVFALLAALDALSDCGILAVLLPGSDSEFSLCGGAEALLPELSGRLSA